MASISPPILKLPLTIAPEPLAAEASGVAAEAWTPHFNRGDYEGDWSGLALRSVGGEAGRLFVSNGNPVEFANTALLAEMPATAAILSAFQCDMEMVRYLKLGAGSEILEHQDFDLSFENGVARVHIPVVTDPAVRFHLDGHRVVMAPGECWYLDFNRPHRVENDSLVDRIHLVIDLVVNTWVENLFAAGQAGPGPAPRAFNLS
jgi:hypothetical protein